MQRAESSSSGPAALWVLDKQLPILEQATFKIQIKSCCCHRVYWFHWDHLDAGTCLSLSFCWADANFYFQINIINAFHYYLSQSNLQLPQCYACCLCHLYLYLFWASFSVFLLRLRLDFCLLWKPFILQGCGGKELCPVVYTWPCACSGDVVHSVSTSMHACFQRDLTPTKTHSLKR